MSWLKPAASIAFCKGMALLSRRSVVRATTIFVLTLTFLSVSLPLSARGGMPRLVTIRDAEIEYNLRQMMTPIMQVAGLEPEAVNFVLVQDNVINAFVAGGMNVFVYTGLIQKTETPDELIGVLAHELGHVAGGHLVRGTEAMRNASYEAILGMVAGLAVGILAKNSQAAIATLGGTQELAARNFFSFSRAQEGAADAAALRFLDGAQWSAGGFLSFMKKLQGEEYLPAGRQSEYVRTHPLTGDRVSAVAHHIETSPYNDRILPPSYTDMHARIKAKLLGFLQPENALLRTTDKDTAITARYARAIALYRTNRLDQALKLTDELIQTEPNNPFFHELRGQMLYENGRITEAIAAYQMAVKLLPGSALLQAALGNALLQDSTPNQTEAAIMHLREAARIEPQSPATWRALATAWGQSADDRPDSPARGLADYALAEEAIANGKTELAQQLAERALKNLPPDSPYKVRVQDIRLLKEKER